MLVVQFLDNAMFTDYEILEQRHLLDAGFSASITAELVADVSTLDPSVRLRLELGDVVQATDLPFEGSSDPVVFGERAYVYGSVVDQETPGRFQLELWSFDANANARQEETLFEGIEGDSTFLEKTEIVEQNESLFVAVSGWEDSEIEFGEFWVKSDPEQPFVSSGASAIIDEIAGVDDRIFYVGRGFFHQSVWEFMPSSGNSLLRTGPGSENAFLVGSDLLYFSEIRAQDFAGVPGTELVWRIETSDEAELVVIEKLSDEASPLWQSAFDFRYQGASLNGVSFFVGTEGKLWRVDDSETVIENVATLPDRAKFASSIVALDDQLVFLDSADRLWSIEEAGQLNLLRDFADAGSELVVFCGRAFFAAQTGEHGTELWYTDGTSEGTQLATDVQPGAESSNPRNLQFHDEQLFFIGASAEGIDEVWRIDLVEPVLGDLNMDRTVDFEDFLLFSSNFGKQDAESADGDFDGDGAVLFTDFLIFAEQFGG